MRRTRDENKPLYSVHISRPGGYQFKNDAQDMKDVHAIVAGNISDAKKDGVSVVTFNVKINNWEVANDGTNKG